MPNSRGIRNEKIHGLEELFAKRGLRPNLIGNVLHKDWSFEHVDRRSQSPYLQSIGDISKPDLSISPSSHPFELEQRLPGSFGPKSAKYR
jgi:hypothetical protein